jgi:NAD(P)-dependent dehydrogenase (short-subunit alcohol dehydrogenase family)
MKLYPERNNGSNNAAIGIFGSITNLSPDNWRKVIENNLTGAVLVADGECNIVDVSAASLM